MNRIQGSNRRLEEYARRNKTMNQLRDATPRESRGSRKPKRLPRDRSGRTPQTRTSGATKTKRWKVTETEAIRASEEVERNTRPRQTEAISVRNNFRRRELGGVGATNQRRRSSEAGGRMRRMTIVKGAAGVNQ
ncbi:hypothetical protein C922_03726 [Plasmodium inui San Antonio 1]|uniref:Uncharacterized protein n=1 Tax=Plasmodium inui San Antonio 1 TaxID=1237626 RepID=W7AA72_9APIC|nr:hypothetical protein C922_03726 [Plasmodium inui San Antonio 1]EUD65999.1 hypothetical protein C922_03726 [Plasmodium inui San Antonio 1]